MPHQQAFPSASASSSQPRPHRRRRRNCHQPSFTAPSSATFTFGRLLPALQRNFPPTSLATHPLLALPFPPCLTVAAAASLSLHSHSPSVADQPSCVPANPTLLTVRRHTFPSCHPSSSVFHLPPHAATLPHALNHSLQPRHIHGQHPRRPPPTPSPRHSLAAPFPLHLSSMRRLHGPCRRSLQLTLLHTAVPPSQQNASRPALHNRHCLSFATPLSRSLKFPLHLLPRRFPSQLLSRPSQPRPTPLHLLLPFSISLSSQLPLSSFPSVSFTSLFLCSLHTQHTRHISHAHTCT